MYSFDGRLRYSEAAMDGRMSLYSAINYMQDCSIFHSESLGLGVEWLKNRHRAWLLLSWQIEVLDRPVIGEPLKTATWPCRFRLFNGYRNFMIWNGNGDVAYQANSIWVYVDTQTGHPVKAEPEDIDPYVIEPEIGMPWDGRKIALPQELTAHEHIKVRQWMIDTNGHVNNSQYIHMASQFLPEEPSIKKLRVEYRQAAVMGDVVVPESGILDGSSVVKLGAEDGRVFAVVQAFEEQV